MRLKDYVFVIKRLDFLIERKATGAPDELANRLEVSRRTVFRLLDDLKDFGAPIEYNQCRRSYQYTEKFDLKTILF